MRRMGTNEGGVGVGGLKNGEGWGHIRAAFATAEQ